MSTTSDEISPTSEPSEASVPVGPIRLTQLSHGGGCGCKIAPGVLEQILARVSPGLVPPQLLVGRDTCDEVGVY